MTFHLIKKRGGHCTECTKIINEIEQICRVVSPADRTKLRKLNSLLSWQRDIVVKLEDHILDIIEELDISADISDASTIIIFI